MTPPFNVYLLRARIVPVIFATLPTSTAIGTFVTWTAFHPSQLIGSVAFIAVGTILSDIATRGGTRVQPKIYEDMGGKPTTAMLRHRDTRLHSSTKKRLLKFLAAQLDEPAPTEAEEKADPEAADAFYERCGTYLREHTRDHKVFHLLSEDRITYGLRRNLLGMKVFALIMSAVTVAAFAGYHYFHFTRNSDHDFTTTLIVAAVALAHAGYFTLFVDQKGVQDAATKYAHTLFDATERLMRSPPAIIKSPAARKARTTISKKTRGG